MTPPVGQKRAAGSGEASDLRKVVPPACSAGKNFRKSIPASSAVMISPGVIAPGSSGTSLRLGGGNQARRQSRADDEFRAGRGRLVELLRVEHRAGADDRILDLAGDAADRLQRILGTQRDLDHPEAALGQRAGQRHGVGGVLHLQHRNDRLAAEKREELFGFAVAWSLSWVAGISIG